MPQSGSSTNTHRRAWEPPRLTELKINIHTKSNAIDERVYPTEEPPPPAAPANKLGFSFEWGLPLSYHETK